MKDRSEIRDQMYEAYDSVNHTMGNTEYCPACKVAGANAQALLALKARDARISELEEAVELDALDEKTIEEQQADLERLQGTILDLEAELDAQRRANDALRDRVMAEIGVSDRLTVDRESFRSQRDALLAANEELRSVIRQLV